MVLAYLFALTIVLVPFVTFSAILSFKSAGARRAVRVLLGLWGVSTVLAVVSLVGVI